MTRTAVALWIVACASVGCFAGPKAGVVENPKVPLTSMPRQPQQLLFQTDAGVRVADLSRQTVFALGQPGHILVDVSDDGRIVVLGKADAPELAVLRDGVLSPSIRLPAYPTTGSLSPDGRWFATTHHADATMSDSDALSLVDLETMTVTEVPAVRRGRLVQQVAWLRDSTGIAVTMDDEIQVAGAPPRTDELPVYDPVKRERRTQAVPAPDRVRTRWQRLQYEPSEPRSCTASNGTTFDDRWEGRLAVRGMRVAPHSNHPVRSTGLLSDCSLFVVHDEHLWIVSADGRATVLGPIAWTVKPIAFTGAPFKPST